MDRSVNRLLYQPPQSTAPIETLSTLQGADLHKIREFNRLLVLNYIRQHGPIARVKLAQSLGLSRTTVSSIMDVLLREGLVHEGHFLEATSRGGRRAILVHFNADAGRILGVDVGRSHLTMLLTDLSAKMLSQRSVPFDTGRGPEICLPILISEIQAFVAASATDWKTILGIGLGIPGPLDADLHRLSSPPHMPGWNQVNIWEALNDAFDIPLYIDNDANMGALSELYFGAAQGCSDVAYIKLGTGIGCGLILNGRIYRGHGGSAGELGHITLDEHGPICACGNHGCLETFAAANAIVEDALRLAALYEKESPDTPTPFSERIRIRGAAQQRVDVMDVIQSAQDGDPSSSIALERAGEHLGVAIASLINLFNPSVIVVGGGIAHAGSLLFDPMLRVAETTSLPAARRGVKILSATLGDTAIALGAVLSVIETAFSLQPVSGPAHS